MANGIEMRKINCNLVYRTMLKSSILSKQEISRLTELSIPTVSQNLQRLIGEGLVEPTGIMESTGGRRAAGFRCVRGARNAVGIEITQNHIRIVVVNLAGDRVYEMGREAYRFTDTPECYDHIAGRVREVITNAGIEDDRILGVGVSLPCIVDRQENKVTYSRIIDAPEDIADKLSERLPYSIEVFNDANSAGYAEFYDVDQGDELRTLCFYLMLSNSVGGAMMTRSGVYLGENSRSGEIGHVRIVPEGEECYCGQKGCVNAYCSAKVLSGLSGGDLDAFFNLLEQGDKTACEAFDNYLYYLALTVINIRMLADSDIIIGGYVGAYMDRYLDKLREITARLDPYSDSAEYVKSCSFRYDASAIGAALNFIGRFIENL